MSSIVKIFIGYFISIAVLLLSGGLYADQVVYQAGHLSLSEWIMPGTPPTTFVSLLRTKPLEAKDLLNNLDNVVLRSSAGRQIYNSRCALCHGKSEIGNG